MNDFPPKLLRVTIWPGSSFQVANLWGGIAKLKDLATEMGLDVSSNADNGETDLEGISFLHVEIYLAKLREMDVDVKVGPYKVIQTERLTKDGIVLRQPFMKVEVEVEKPKTDVVSKFIAYHRGTITEVIAADESEILDADKIVAEIPLAELETFADELRSISETASFSYTFLEYRDIED